MTTATNPLPVTEIAEPENPQALAALVRESYQSETPVYPLGGQTALDFGLPATRAGLGVSTSAIQRVIDYPARDMTVTVESGITMRQLADILAAENQELPVDVPHAELATLGGLIATNFNGPRRYGRGSLRDYVIGIGAVDGRGNMFHGGGRVVKNVAGYDFCKLLTGSLGTLGVITQVTIKLKPISEESSLLACAVRDLSQANSLLDQLAHSTATPTAIELLAGPAWQQDAVLSQIEPVTEPASVFLVVSIEGTHDEVQWMRSHLRDELSQTGFAELHVVDDSLRAGLWNRIVEFPGEPAPLQLKANVVPSGTVKMIQGILDVDQKSSIQAHAGNGVVIASFSEFPSEGLARTIVGRLQPLASSLHGSVVMLSNPTAAESTHRCFWGGSQIPFQLMKQVKQQFDPSHILNPGRFVYS